MVTLRDRSGETVCAAGVRIVLGQRVKSGGAGSVYLLPAQPQNVAKLYHASTDTHEYRLKIPAMLALKPDLPVIEDRGQRYVQIAWPEAVITELDGSFRGFTMPLLDIEATSELEPVLQERQAKALGLPTNLGAKVTLAANLATAVAALHAQGHYVVDLKPVNLRFYREALYIALLDCDGFSIKGANRRFRAEQCTPDYLAPEFQGVGISADGEHAQDLFALAVVIFQLLNFGIHPFTGKPLSARVPTDIPERIKAGCYAYGLRPNPLMAPSPVSGHADMPEDLRVLFDRAFTGCHRPSADEWSALLTRYARRDSGLVVTCAADHRHQHFADLPCAECARARLLKAARAQVPIRAQQRAAQRANAVRQGIARLGRSPAVVVGRRVVGTGGATRTASGGVGGLLGLGMMIVFVVFAFGLLAHSCSSSRDYDTGVDNTPAVSAPVAPTSAQATVDGTSLAMSQIVPVSNKPAPAVTRANVLALLDAVEQGDRARFAARMGLMKSQAAAYPDAQPASLDAFYDVEARIAKTSNEEIREHANDPSPAASVAAARNAAAEHAREVFDMRFRQIIDADPYARFAVIELAARSLQEGKRKDARALFRLAVIAHPDRSDGWYGLGLAYVGDDDRLAAASLAVARVLEHGDSSGESDLPMLAELVSAAAGEDHMQRVNQLAAKLAAAMAVTPTAPAPKPSGRAAGSPSVKASS